jgi:hypothetical protein
MLTHQPIKEVAIVMIAQRSAITAAVALGVAVLSAAAALAVVPSKVLGTPKNEFQGTSATGYFAYAQSRSGSPNTLDVYLKPAGQPRFKVNPGASQAVRPDLDLGNPTWGDTLIYTRVAPGDDNIAIYDIDDGVHRAVSGLINDSADQRYATLSGNHILYGRAPANQLYIKRIILFDIMASSDIVLDVAPTNGLVYPGTVDGDWASWTKCSLSDCSAWRYQISTHTTSEVPSNGRLVYTAAVSTDGTVWYLQSGFGCGVNVKLRRHTPGSPATTLFSFPGGVDANVSDLDETGATRRLYFDRVNCAHLNNWDIYRIAAD